MKVHYGHWQMLQLRMLPTLSAARTGCTQKVRQTRNKPILGKTEKQFQKINNGLYLIEMISYMERED